MGSVRIQPRLDIPVIAPGGRTCRIERDRLPAPLHLGRSLARYGHLALRDRLKLGRAALALKGLDLDDPALDEVTFGAWLARHGQSDRAISALWDLIVRPTTNLPADQVSLSLAAKVFQTGLLSRSDASDIGWAAVPLGQLHGELVASALASAGVEVRTGVTARSVRSLEDGPVVDLRAGAGDGAGAGEERLAADAVVVALPHDLRRGVVGEQALGAEVSGLGMSPIVDVAVVFDRKITDHDLAAAVGSPVEWIFDRTHTAGVTRGQCLTVSLSAADGHLGRRPNELVASMVEALGELLPEVRRAQVIDAVVTRERTATFRGVPGTRALRVGPTTRLAGVFVAGAWTDTGWPATMEGAVRSGRSAARQCLAASPLSRRSASPGADIDGSGGHPRDHEPDNQPGTREAVAS
jgi:squalene-associated FAD-dependent desaturase